MLDGSRGVFDIQDHVQLGVHCIDQMDQTLSFHRHQFSLQGQFRHEDDFRLRREAPDFGGFLDEVDESVMLVLVDKEGTCQVSRDSSSQDGL